MASKLPRPITCQPSVVHREMYLPYRPVESIEIAKTETADLYGTAHLPIRLQVPLSGNKNEKCKEFEYF